MCVKTITQYLFYPTNPCLSAFKNYYYPINFDVVLICKSKRDLGSCYIWFGHQSLSPVKVKLPEWVPNLVSNSYGFVRFLSTFILEKQDFLHYHTRKFPLIKKSKWKCSHWHGTYASISQNQWHPIPPSWLSHLARIWEENGRQFLMHWCLSQLRLPMGNGVPKSSKYYRELLDKLS